jgi:hypothetical protein
MELSPKLKQFYEEDRGAVSIDWVVMTAAIVSLGILIGTSVNNIPDDVLGKVDTYAQGVDVTSGTANDG